MEEAYFLSGNSFDQEDSKTGSISMAKLTSMFILFFSGVTAVAMVISEICALVMRPASTIIHPVCSAGFIVNNIPFFSLNFSIVLGIVVQLVTAVFFEFLVPFWLHTSVIVATILATNKGARKHVALRLRQQIATFTIGGNNTVHQVVSVASRLRQQIDSFTIGGNNTVHPVVSIALVPLRSLTGPAPTLPTSTRATLCPVEAFECKEEGGVDNYGCKVEDIELLFEDSEEDEDVKEEKDRVERRMDSEEEEGKWRR